MNRIPRADWMKGLLASLVLAAAVQAWALPYADRKAVTNALTDKVKHLRDEGSEARLPRVLTEEFFTNPGKLDVIAFLTWIPKDEENALKTYVFILSDPGKGYRIIASSLMERVDPAYAKVQDQDLFLRSSEDADADNRTAYGEEKVYSRWRVVDGELQRIGGVWLRRDAGFVEFKAP